MNSFSRSDLTSSALTSGADAPLSGSSSPYISEGTVANFMQAVMEASQKTPVVIVFYTPRSPVCLDFTALLGKLINTAGGRLLMVKIDVEQNRPLVEQLIDAGLPVQSVPAAASVWKGQILDMFQGLLPEGEVKKFLSDTLKAAGSALPQEDLLVAAKQAFDNNAFEEALLLFQDTLGQDPENPEAFGGLIRAYLGLNNPEAAREIAENIPEKIKEHTAVRGALAALDLIKEENIPEGDSPEFLQKQIALHPEDTPLRFELAKALNRQNLREQAAEELLAIMRSKKAPDTEEAKALLLKFFEAWGFDHPDTLKARRRLSALLFS